MLKWLVWRLALRNAKYLSLYVRICKPNGLEYAQMVKHHKLLYSMGSDCSILPSTHLGADAKYVRLGNNVRLAGCSLLCHDGVVNMLGIAYGVDLDAVGKIDIGDNVFVGAGATILRGVTIGDNCVVAAGAVVAKDILSNSVVAGVPAKKICSTDELVARLLTECQSQPWYRVIKRRGRHYEPNSEIERELDRERLKAFFGSKDADCS